MKRTQVQIDEATYERLRREAFERGMSVSALVREVLQERFGTRPRRYRLEDFGFIASGESEQGDLAPVSERHDEALGREPRW